MFAQNAFRIAGNGNRTGARRMSVSKIFPCRDDGVHNACASMARDVMRMRKKRIVLFSSGFAHAYGIAV
ncbi:MAG: hypothetical protein WBA56_00105 [Stenotrophomonas sp.]